MNPVDHPHGGGRGKSKGRISQTPWGKPTKGYRTRNNPRTDWVRRVERGLEQQWCTVERLIILQGCAHPPA